MAGNADGRAGAALATGMAGAAGAVLAGTAAAVAMLAAIGATGLGGITGAGVVCGGMAGVGWLGSVVAGAFCATSPRRGMAAAAAARGTFCAGGVAISAAAGAALSGGTGTRTATAWSAAGAAPMAAIGGVAGKLCGAAAMGAGATVLLPVGGLAGGDTLAGGGSAAAWEAGDGDEVASSRGCRGRTGWVSGPAAVAVAASAGAGTVLVAGDAVLIGLAGAVADDVAATAGRGFAGGMDAAARVGRCANRGGDMPAGGL
jgi:hypothetical protein